MGGKINVYNLGEQGVNVVKSPIHLTDGELRSAQNAIWDPSEAEGGIRKRGGMPRFSGSAMAGAVRGIVNVPLAAPGDITRTFYLALGTFDSDTWATSANGTTWAEGATPARSQSLVQTSDAAVQYQNQRMATINRRIYYPGNDYVQYPAANHTAPSVRVFDGTNDYELFRIPYNPASGSTTNTKLITDFVVHDGRLYMAVYDPGGSAPDHRGRVFEFDPDTGTITQVGNAFGGGAGENTGGMPFCLASHNGYLWAGTYGISGLAVGKIYSIRPGVDSTWALKVTTATGAGYIMSMVSFRGELYFGTQGDAGSAALLRKLSNTGALSTIDTGSATDAGNYYAGLIVFEDNLYVSYVNLAPAMGKTTHIRKYDGTSVTTDRDVDATDAGARDMGQPFVYGSALYFPFLGTAAANNDGFLLRKTSGTWSNVLTANIRGFFGRVDVHPG